MGRMGKRGPAPAAGREDWQKKTIRIDSYLRAQVVEMANALRLPMDAVARLAVRRYARLRGVELPGWVDVEPSLLSAIRNSASGGDLKMWVRMPGEWFDVQLPALCAGEVRTPNGVIREALRHLHGEGKGSWRAELANVPSPAATTA